MIIIIIASCAALFIYTPNHRQFPLLHAEYNHSNVITMCILSVLVGVPLLLCSLWNCFILQCFSIDLASSGVSELLIMSLIWLELPLSLPACTVFYKGTYFPLEMPLHDMTSKEMAIPMRPVSKKRIPNCLLPWRPICYTKSLC